MSARPRLWPRPRRSSSAKVPEPLSGGQNLYTIPPSAPFLTTLARAVLAGDLPLAGGPKPDPLALPFTTIYLPTRRAARALREAFLAEASSEALLLPRIRALGDPDEEAALIFGAEDGGVEGIAGAPAIGELQRHTALMRLVLAFGRALRSRGARRGRELRAGDAGASLLSRRRSRSPHGRRREGGDRFLSPRRHRAGGIRRALAAHRRFPQDRHRALARVTSPRTGSSRPSRAATL